MNAARCTALAGTVLGLATALFVILSFCPQIAVAEDGSLPPIDAYLDRYPPPRVPPPSNGVVTTEGGVSAQNTVNVGKGSYATQIPAGHSDWLPPSYHNHQPATPSRTFSGPVPTNDWWTSMVYQFYYCQHPTYDTENMFPHPLQVHNFKPQAPDVTGVAIGYNADIQIPGPTWYIADWAEDLRVSVKGLTDAAETTVTAFSDWTVTASFSDGANGVEATFGPGFPFVYFTKTGGFAEIHMGNNHSVWYNQQEVVGFTVGSHHYGVFGPPGATWQQTGYSYILQSSLAGQDYFTIAILPDNTQATLEYYRKRAYAWPTDTRVSWSYDEGTARLTTTYSVTTALKTTGSGLINNTLLTLFPHHWRHSTDSLTSYEYTGTIRGALKVLDANQFTTELAFHGILPWLPNKAGSYHSDMQSWVQAIAALQINTPDTYWTGKNLSKMALVAPIAEQLGMNTERDQILATVEDKLEQWFQANQGTNLFVLNDTWGTLIGYPGSYGSDWEINDHHFHYGYYVVAAAIVSHFNPDWSLPEEWGGMVEMLIHDVANPDRSSTMFPFLRTFSPYPGWSYASGHAESGGNGQEAVSEAMNFATGLILWGSLRAEQTGDTGLRDLGIYLYLTEASTTEEYRLNMNGGIFPSGWTHSAIGWIWDAKSTFQNASGTAPIYSYAQNWLPMNGGSLYLGRVPTFTQKIYHDLVSETGGPVALNQWANLSWEYLALADASAARTLFDNNVGDPTFQEEFGSSKAHTCHSIYNLEALGQLNASITADIPTYAVFTKGGTNTCVAYNPSNTQAKTVNFSDGSTLNVPARQLAAEPCSSAALTLSKHSSHDPVRPGDTFTYTLRFTNTGTLDLHATVSDTLPTDLHEPTGILTWTPTVTAHGGVWTHSFTATTKTDYTGPLTSVVGTTTTQGATHVHTHTVHARAHTELLVSKTGSPDPVRPGFPLQYTIWVTNTGNVPLTAHITDTLPSQLVPSGTITWTNQVIAAHGGTWTQSFTRSVAEGYTGTLTNSVEVGTEEGVWGAYTSTIASHEGALVSCYLPVVHQGP